VLKLPREEVSRRIESVPLDFRTPSQVQTTPVTDGSSGIPSTGSQQPGMPAAPPARESQLPVAAEPGDAALHKRLADLKLQLEIKKLEEELRQREVTAGGGSSGAPVGGSMAATVIRSEQPQPQPQEQQQQQQQQQVEVSSTAPHGNEGAGDARQAPAEQLK